MECFMDSYIFLGFFKGFYEECFMILENVEYIKLSKKKYVKFMSNIVLSKLDCENIFF